MNSETVKRTFFCECTGSAFAAGDIVSLEFIWPGAPPRGGQFFLIKPRRSGVFLARPVSAAGFTSRNVPSGDAETAGDEGGVENRRFRRERRKSGAPGHSPDRRINADRRGGGILRFLVARRGAGSRELADLRPGEEAELTGPLGNYWPLAGDLPETDAGPVALVGGGIGIAPLLAFARELESRKRPFDFYAGFKNSPFCLEEIKPRSLVIVTEDGSRGLKGRVPDFFTPRGYGGVFVCGPEPMLKTVAEACIAAVVPCFISMERHMACGVGACLGCTVKTFGGNRRCCADGPVFNAKEIIF